MPRNVRLDEAAVDDLLAVRRWLTQAGAGRAAKRRLEKIDAAIRRLQSMPCLHPVGHHPGVREIICEGHSILYEVHPDTGRNATAGDVLVLRVFGPGQSRDQL